MKGHASEAELNDRIDGVLSPRRGEELERHFTACPTCARRFATAWETVNRLRALPRRAQLVRVTPTRAANPRAGT